MRWQICVASCPTVPFTWLWVISGQSDISQFICRDHIDIARTSRVFCRYAYVRTPQLRTFKKSSVLFTFFFKFLSFADALWRTFVLRNYGWLVFSISTTLTLSTHLHVSVYSSITTSMHAQLHVQSHVRVHQHVQCTWSACLHTKAVKLKVFLVHVGI